jgi:hypothetical protein
MFNSKENDLMKNENKYLLVGVVTLGLLLGSVGNVAAITHGQLDGDGHPYVGLIIFDVGGKPALQCTGSLIAPTVVVTAGHCTSAEGQNNISGGRIWFESDPNTDPNFPFGGGTSIEFTSWHTDPALCLGCGHGLPGADTHDVGIVILSRPVTNVGFAALPTVGFADTLPKNTLVTAVGYGVQTFTTGKPPHEGLADNKRYFAPQNLLPSNDVIHAEFLKLSFNPAQGKGGTCFGDSGGPNLVGNIMVAITSFGAANGGGCHGGSYAYRLDTPEALSFINSFLL